LTGQARERLESAVWAADSSERTAEGRVAEERSLRAAERLTDLSRQVSEQTLRPRRGLLLCVQLSQVRVLQLRQLLSQLCLLQLYVQRQLSELGLLRVGRGDRISAER
jgi:hypothetical protein